MLNIVMAPENWLFSSALCLMLLIGIIEALGLGAVGGDAGGLDGDHPLFGWIGVGPLPMSIALILFLGAFALCGFAVQQVAAGLTGGPLPALAAAAAALLIALPATRLSSRALARILPADETTAIGLDSLIGRRGHILVGAATLGAPARARVRDAFGHSHYLLVEPHVADAALGEGNEILLVGRDAGAFRAVAVAPHLSFEVHPHL